MNTPPPDDPLRDRWYTVTEIARILRVSKMTIYRAILRGDLPAHIVGERTFRVSEHDLRAYLERALATYHAQNGHEDT